MARVLDRLGALHSTMAQYAKAEPLFHKALTIARAAWGDNHPAVAEVLGGLIKAFRDYEQKNESAWRKAS